MPFVTEEIYSRIPGHDGRVMVAPYPRTDDFPADEDAADEYGFLMDVISAVRNIRSELRISPGKPLDLVVALR